ncbi:MAG TPA: DUF2059 domain-containing protein [Methylovirgula sp.]|nr:DUF2059 domain-containing protein [Methylovirgula sp.]
MSVSFDRHRNRLRAAIAVAGALLLAAPAVAQDAKPAPAPATPPAAAAPAPAPTPVPEPSASHLAAARELVIASGMSRSFDAAIPHMMAQLTQTMAQTRPEIMTDLKAVLEGLKPDFAKDIDQMTDKAAHIYAQYLSEDDIKAAIAFFNSDAGKKYVKSEPLYFNAVINAMQDWHMQLQTELMTKVRAEMQKRGKTL